MEYSDDLCKLVIQNINVLEEAPKIISHIEQKLFSSINRHLERSINNLSDWDGVFKIVTDKQDDTYFGPDSWNWNMRKDQKKGAYFALYYFETPSDADYYSLSHALGLNGTALSFDFSLKSSTLNKKQIEKLLKDFIQKNTILADKQFVYNKKEACISLPFYLDTKVLLENYPDFELAFAPMDEALAKIFETQEIFNELFEEIKAK